MSGECVLGVGAKDKDGYGRRHITVGPNSEYSLRTHRVAWEQSWGLTIPPGMVVMHTCDNPPCVNPLHLMIGTVHENVRDRDRKGRNACARRTHCPLGHPYTEKRDTDGSRHCRPCSQERSRIWRAKRDESTTTTEGAP